MLIAGLAVVGTSALGWFEAPAGPATTLSADTPSPTLSEAAPSVAESTQTPTPTDTPEAPAVDLATELPLTDRDQAVAAVVAAAVGEPGLARSSDELTVTVRDPLGRDVFDHRSHDAWIPASTEKLVTAAAALRFFGADHRFTTEVRGVVGDDGIVTGDLFVVGGGDPTLTTDDYRRFVYPSRPASELEQLADQVVAAGVREVRGAVVGDGTRFRGETVPPGWKAEYLDDQNGRHITALTVDAGLDLTVEIPEDGRGPQLTLLSEPDPVTHAASRFTDLLRERGVLVRGAARSIAAPAPSRPVLGSLESPTLQEILTFMMQRSDNHLADTVFRSVGAAGALPASGGTWGDATAETLRVLEGLGVDTAGLRIADGSGLSRDNRLTGDAMAELDAVMWAEEPSWPGLMAVMGRSGTLRNRLRGTIADGRVRGKTGTLDDVKAVELTVEDRAGVPRYHVAVIGNAAQDRWVVQVLIDELALRISEVLDGCTRVATGATPSASTPPVVVPYDLVCPTAPLPGPEEPPPPTSPEEATSEPGLQPTP